jgi:UDP-N-acetylmuramate: L-alanyl-gamma-D-glutamyl-meso-diaminopimelate ligase
MKHIHFIGICGVGMSALAILYHKKGWKVTGSDVGFYPPISTHLEAHQITFYPGWHPELVGTPDLVVVGNVAGSENPELKYVLGHHIPQLSYPELIAQDLIKEHSVVCAGTYGKSSSTALLTRIFQDAGLNPTYMIGGLALDLPESAGEPVNSTWSIMEGDEYKTSRDNPRAKFFLYRPTHLLLTGLAWDHLDVYATEQHYLDAFRELIGMIPEQGLIVACLDSTHIPELLKERLQETDTTTPLPRLVTYGKTADVDYRYHITKESVHGLEMSIHHAGQDFTLTIPVLGTFMAENICGAFALAHTVGIPSETIIGTLAGFHGLKRRLEKRGVIEGVTVFDDIAHSPTKATSVLSTLKAITTGKIYAVFEPNIGNRKRDAAPAYDHAFKDADMVFIPRLTKLKKNLTDPADTTFEGAELVSIIGLTQPETYYVDEDPELLHLLRTKTQPGDTIVFMGSHGFRGMIEDIITLE